MVVPVCRLRAAYIAGVILKCATGTRCLGLRFAAESAAGICAPHVRRAGAIHITRPPILGGRRGARKIGRVQRDGIAVVVIENAEEFARRRQPPVGEAAGVHRGCIRDRVLPGGLAIVRLLPHQARDIVRDRAVAVVGERLRIERVVRVFAKRRRRVGHLTRVRNLQLTRRRHTISREARDGRGIARRVSRGRGRAGKPPRDRERTRVHVPIDLPALVVICAADRDAHEIRILRRRAADIFDQMPRPIRGQRDGIFERHDRGASHRLRRVAARAGLAKRAHFRLAIHLIAEVHHGPVENVHRVWTLRRSIRMRRIHGRRADGVIVIAPAISDVVPTT